MIDENRYLILIDAKVKTSEIDKMEKQGQKTAVTFLNNGRTYTYGAARMQILEDPSVIDHHNNLVFLDNKPLFKVVKVLDFGQYVKVFFEQGQIRAYSKNRIHFEHNVLQEGDAAELFGYLRALSQCISDEENDFLTKQYEKVRQVSDESVLAQFLQPRKVKTHSFDSLKVFPFGFNLSQEAAVSKALTHQVSIIEGPPGTGKTQTILNILANLVMNDKTVAIASNNNTAIINVFEKLQSQELSFFTAVLGKKENRQAFVENQTERYPEIEDKDNSSVDSKDLNRRTEQIKEMLAAQNALAQNSQELEALQLEKEHFLQSHQEIVLPEERQRFIHYSLKKVLVLWADLEQLQQEGKEVSFFFKIKMLFKYRLFFASELYRYSLNEIIIFLQSCVYDIKEQELKEIIKQAEGRLADYDFENMLHHHKMDSMHLFRSYLFKRYALDKARKQFSSDDLWKNFNAVIDEYPVILSTTHALRQSTGQDFLYDYLIIDEASQVDVVAGALAMSCAKNVVIVGDLKQLPHIVKSELEETIDTVFDQYRVSAAYHYKNSLLHAASVIWKDAPKTLLREHYRCHPKIIDFCNQKFYNNELIILSKHTEDASPLTLVHTVQGNHARGRYNQRQIDVIKHEILPKLHTKDLGIISPFRKQVDKLSQDIDGAEHIEIDTVHKYQGREKETIIITTVVDRKNDFADDPNLLNVAISRAQKQLYVVVSDNEKNKNMKDLVSYMKYNNLQIEQSRLYSVFDMLYQSYAPYLEGYMKKIQNVSEYKSENLMNTVIEKVLSGEGYSHLAKVLHLSLNRMIRETDFLNDKERKFVQNPSTHVDFLIYNKINKQAILAVEVDGVAFHENNPVQLQRDSLKDGILSKYNIPIIRFATNGSGEEQRLLGKLKEINA